MAATSAAPIQRAVDRVKTESGIQYYSTLDRTREMFPTVEEARARDAGLREREPYDPKTRHPTFFSYATEKPWNIVTGKPQGPHTLGHAAISEAFSGALGRGVHPMELFHQQVPRPEQFRGLVAAEAERPSAAMSERFDRAQFVYKNLHEDICAIGESSPNHPALPAMIRQIMEMHPHGTYGWKTGQKEKSKKSTKGKGETGDIWDDRNVDMPRKGVLDPAGVRAYIDLRRGMAPRPPSAASASAEPALAAAAVPEAGFALESGTGTAAAHGIPSEARGEELADVAVPEVPAASPFRYSGVGSAHPSGSRRPARMLSRTLSGTSFAVGSALASGMHSGEDLLDVEEQSSAVPAKRGRSPAVKRLASSVEEEEAKAGEPEGPSLPTQSPKVKRVRSKSLSSSW